MMIRRLVRVVPFFATLILAAGWSENTNGALVFDAADEFSISSNPNSVWSYGFRDTAASVSFSPYTSTDSTFLGKTNLYAWLDMSDLVPSISKNVGASPITVYDTTWQPGQLVIHPGQPGDIDEYVVLRWTAPNDGLFSIDVTFTGIVAMGGATTNVQVIDGSGSSVFDANISGGLGSATNTHSFSSTLALAKDDSIDFIAGPGTSYISDSTAVDLRIRWIPEPCTLVIWSLLASLGITAGWWRRKHKTR